METTPATAPAAPAATPSAPRPRVPDDAAQAGPPDAPDAPDAAADEPHDAPPPAPPREAAPRADFGAGYGLSARELAVARLMLDGLKNDEIAARLGLSFYTARNHITHILRKLGVSSRTKAAAKLLGVKPVEGGG